MNAIMAEQHKGTLDVARAQHGDRDAFDVLFTRFEERLTAFIGSRIKPGYRERLNVEDILQDTFVRAFQSMGSFRGQGDTEFRRWLTGVANKAVLRAEDEACRQRTLQMESAVPAGGASPSRELRREERFDRLQGALNSLTGDYRQVIFLTRIEGMSIKDAAERMGRSPGATKKLFWRALRKLRRIMAETGSLHLPDRELEWEKDHDGTQQG